MRIIIAVVFAAVLTLSGSAQEFMADGAPADAFRSPIDRLRTSLARFGAMKKNAT
jgi:hypothetical protein